MRVRRLSDLSVNRMVPNVLTLLALCAGMTAMRFAMVGNFEGAVFAIIAAGIFDGLDGRMARLLKATSSLWRGARQPGGFRQLRCWLRPPSCTSGRCRNCMCSAG